MHLRFKLAILFVVFVLFWGPLVAFAQANSISRENFRTELILLKGQLENFHPNLYIYHTAQELDQTIDSITSSLDSHIDIWEAYHHVSFLAAYIQDGHSLVYPGDKTLQQFYGEGPLFPLDIFYDGEKLNIISDYSEENAIPLGSEIISINGRSTEELYQFMLNRLPRDGNNMQYPRHIFYKFFSAYYSFFFGFKNSYEIKYIDTIQELKTVNIKSLTRGEIRIRKEEQGHIERKAIQLKVDEENHMAILKISTFDKEMLKNDFEQNFKKEIRSALRIIKKNKLENLVIDLRDNQGGDISNGAFLLNQLSKKKIKLVHSLQGMKIDEMRSKRVMKKKINIEGFTLMPFIKQYKGNIFLLTNSGSYSCSALVANAFQKNNLGLIIGEMTGGSRSINCGSPNETITLPYSKIIYTIPTTRFKLNEKVSREAQGVIPDIEIKENFKMYIGGEDVFLETARLKTERR